MEPKLVIGGIFCLIMLLFIFSPIKLFKWTNRMIGRLLIGIFLIYLINLIGNDHGLQVAINGYTAAIAAILGVPGVLALVVLNQWII